MTNANRDLRPLRWTGMLRDAVLVLGLVRLAAVAAGARWW